MWTGLVIQVALTCIGRPPPIRAIRHPSVTCPSTSQHHPPSLSMPPSLLRRRCKVLSSSRSTPDMHPVRPPATTIVTMKPTSHACQKNAEM
ncbi:hypothetical protein P152DRAFT_462721 [Eremomyces bilateralis CBS 781.70]|uniref:Uncharacterized protein n=1 Tax=Eremomyces bilateralis CBS 781.70 TaxID=1392243 RepID=A0A6G1FRD8_9PEZI|nr:uncharacterized protein P152DRAFT_462721 [Eremomyces bilateralis CBS 781.70]KAF1808232.1 hypothetical protein P152DRAFT_462721 [Eremomyces bilateralis CBS 781.70]